LSSNGEFIRLETIGRRTGRPHTVLLRFIAVDNRVVVFPGKGSVQDWVQNIRTDPHVRVHAGGSVMEGTASLRSVTGLRDPILSIFTRKYGDKVVRGGYWGQTEYIQVELGATVSTESRNDLVYSDLEAAFDGVAEDYDHHIFGNPVNLWLRNRSLAVMLQLFRPGQTVLEVGCGTGTETLSMARRGVKVVAVDVSSKMLDVLERKAAAEGLGDMVIPVHSRPYRIASDLSDRGFPTVDGAYSTYGAVNTDPRLPDFFQNLHSVVKPGGRLVLGVWNRYCLFEMVGYGLKGNYSMAGARFRNPVPVGRSRFCVASNAFSVSEVSQMLSGLFKQERTYGVCVFLPPSNLTKYLPPGGLASFAKRADAALAASFPWNRLGDHFLGVYRRVS